jgi:hypothetical protein
MHCLAVVTIPLKNRGNLTLALSGAIEVPHFPRPQLPTMVATAINFVSVLKRIRAANFLLDLL